MPIENIKIIRDGEIIQTTGIDGLLLEKVGIYEYLNLTKKIQELQTADNLTDSP